MKVTAVPSSICECYLIFAPLRILNHLKNRCCGVCKYCEIDTSLTLWAADGKSYDLAFNQRELHILCFCDLFLACHESSEGVHENIYLLAWQCKKYLQSILRNKFAFFSPSYPTKIHTVERWVSPYPSNIFSLNVPLELGYP